MTVANQAFHSASACSFRWAMAITARARRSGSPAQYATSGARGATWVAIAASSRSSCGLVIAALSASCSHEVGPVRDAVDVALGRRERAVVGDGRQIARRCGDHGVSFRLGHPGLLTIGARDLGEGESCKGRLEAWGRRQRGRLAGDPSGLVGRPHPTRRRASACSTLRRQSRRAPRDPDRSGSRPAQSPDCRATLLYDMATAEPWVNARPRPAPRRMPRSRRPLHRGSFNDGLYDRGLELLTQTIGVGGQVLRHECDDQLLRGINRKERPGADRPIRTRQSPSGSRASRGQRPHRRCRVPIRQLPPRALRIASDNPFTVIDAAVSGLSKRTPFSSPLLSSIWLKRMKSSAVETRPTAPFDQRRLLGERHFFHFERRHRPVLGSLIDRRRAARAHRRRPRTTCRSCRAAAGCA